MPKREIHISIDSEGRVTEGEIFYGRIQKDEENQVSWQDRSYPTYRAFSEVPVGRYRESRHAIFAVVLGMKLPSSLE